MKRRGGLFGALLGAALILLLIAGTVTVLAVTGKITVSGVSPKKTAGRVVEVGSFNASILEVKDVVGNVSIVVGNVSNVMVKSNLPVKASVRNNVLLVYCPTKTGILGRRNVCNDYKNGTVIIEVPRGLTDAEIHDVVGDVLVAAPSPTVEASDIVGGFYGAAWSLYRVSDVVGDVSLNAKENADISDVVGDVTVRLPPGTRAVVRADDVVGKVINTADGKKGTIEVAVNDIVGDVTVKS